MPTGSVGVAASPRLPGGGGRQGGGGEGGGGGGSTTSEPLTHSTLTHQCIGLYNVYACNTIDSALDIIYNTHIKLCSIV